MTEYIEGRLGYNSRTDRYGLLVSDLWEHAGFHCRESLEVWNGNEWVPTRMEMAPGGIWYLVGTDFKGSGLEYLRARIPK